MAQLPQAAHIQHAQQGPMGSCKQGLQQLREEIMHCAGVTRYFKLARRLTRTCATSLWRASALLSPQSIMRGHVLQ
jgi:hypothetical protein